MHTQVARSKYKSRIVWVKREKSLFFNILLIFKISYIHQFSTWNMNNQDPTLESWDFGAQIESHESFPEH